MENGRSAAAAASGQSAKPEPSCTVSAQGATVPNAELVENYARARASRDGLAEHRPCDAWMKEARFAAAFFERHYGAEIASLREKLSDALAADGGHRSDCAVHNAPAFEPGPCDCGVRP